jgi:hypothetical protein
LITQKYLTGHVLNDMDRILLALPEEDRGKVMVGFGLGLAADRPGAKRGALIIMLGCASKA